MPAVLRFETREVAHRFRMRVLRIFLVAAHFPVDRNYRRGNMNCKARQELCRSDLLLPVTLWPTPALASPLECAVTKNAPATPLEYALAKSLDLKSPEINTYKKGWGILAGRDAGATKSFPPPFCLLPLTVCLLPPRDSTELTTAVSPARLSFRGPTFSVGPRNLSERSLARRVRLGMTGQKK